MTFKACAKAYIIEAHRAGWKNPIHAKQWPSTLAAYAYPVFGDEPVSAVDTAKVMQALSTIWAEKTETATRVRGRIEATLDWARVQGYRTGDNPARWSGHLEHLLMAPAKAKAAKRRETGRGEHHETLPYRDLPASWRSCAPIRAAQRNPGSRQPHSNLASYAPAGRARHSAPHGQKSI
jgi:hypothetical protein